MNPEERSPQCRFTWFFWAVLLFIYHFCSCLVPQFPFPEKISNEITFSLTQTGNQSEAAPGERSQICIFRTRIQLRRGKERKKKNAKNKMQRWNQNFRKQSGPGKPPDGTNLGHFRGLFVVTNYANGVKSTALMFYIWNSGVFFHTPALPWSWDPWVWGFFWEEFGVAGYFLWFF